MVDNTSFYWSICFLDRGATESCKGSAPSEPCAGIDANAEEGINQLLKALPDLLARVARQRKVIIILDALNRIDSYDQARSLRWLPQELVSNVRFLISTTPGEIHNPLLQRAVKPDEVEVGTLTESEIKELVQGYLTEIRREFPNRQVADAFYEKIKSRSAIYITLALEELRVFGQFEDLPQRSKRTS